MNRPIIRIHNTETNQIIDREMNNDELAQWEIDKAEAEATAQAEAEAAAKRTTALAKLEALGLNEADLTALGL